ncbi:MAG: metallophosphoesterase [Paraglaciecola sp.]|uniref:metallophosphoesterase family protein n=1 Tax=Paraglaciecola sp. TaxID=1920173 RepID=UPI0032987678
MSEENIRIMQLSDIHFHESSDGNTDNYRHSINCLKKIQGAFENESPNILVVSGDITNIGDKISLERAYQWLNDKIYVDGDYYGLSCQKKNIPIIAVPGNHDAFNASSSGANYKRWQSSLENFYSVFHDHTFSNRMGVDYDWHSAGTTNVFICRLDSCYLGDNETEHLPGKLSLSRIAKGNFSKEQSAEILKLYDAGIKGELVNRDSSPISSGDFMSSLKILVMHHYLFEPPDEKAEELLHIKDKRTVFQNIAMSDFDILLCGHKHIADVHKYSYKDHFDERGKVRIAFNHVRRSLGISSLPLLKDNENGQNMGKLFRFLVGFLVLSKRDEGGLDAEHTNEIISILQRSLESPLVLREELQRYLKKKSNVSQAGLFDDDEIRELHEKIKDTFSSDERKKLSRVAITLKGLIERLGGRPFVQLIAGSSAKSSEHSNRSRALNTFEVSHDSKRQGTNFSYRRFLWDGEAVAQDGSKGNFMSPLEGDFFFPNDRIAALLEE